MMQQAAYQEFLAQHGLHPSQPNNPVGFPYQHPSLNPNPMFSDYMHLEKPVIAQKGKSLGSALPRRTSDYVDFSNVRKPKHEKNSGFRNFSCIPENNRAAASCENLSSTAWNCAEQVGCTHKKKKSKLLPKFLPSFLFRKKKSKQPEEIFIAVQNLPNLRKRSCTINNCESTEQLYDSPIYESRDFIQGQCMPAACSRVPPLHPNNTSPAFVNQSNCLNIQPLVLSSTPNQYCDRNGRVYPVQHGRNHSYGHSCIKDPPQVLHDDPAVPVDKLVYYPIITADRSNTYVTYYPSHHHQQHEVRGHHSGRDLYHFDLNANGHNAHSNQVYESSYSGNQSHNFNNSYAVQSALFSSGSQAARPESTEKIERKCEKVSNDVMNARESDNHSKNATTEFHTSTPVFNESSLQHVAHNGHATPLESSNDNIGLAKGRKCNERKMRSPKLKSSQESSDNLCQGSGSQNCMTRSAGQNLSSMKETKNNRKSPNNGASSSNQHRVLSLENSIAATNNHSVSSSPEHKSSGYATLDTANSLMVNAPSPKANQQPPQSSQSQQSGNPDTSQSKSNSSNFLQVSQPTQVNSRPKQARIPLNDIRKRTQSSNRAESRQDSKCTQTYPEFQQVLATHGLVVPQSLPSTNPNFRVRKSSVGGPESPKSPAKSHQVKYYFDFSLASIQPSDYSQFPMPQHSKSPEKSRAVYGESGDNSQHIDQDTMGRTHGRSAPASPVFPGKFSRAQNEFSRKSAPYREHDYSTITAKTGAILPPDMQAEFTREPSSSRQQKNSTSNSFYRSFEQDLKKLNQFFDSQGATESTLRKFRKNIKASTPSELGSIPSINEPRPEPHPCVITQHGLAENHFLNPPMTDFDKTLLVLNWLMHCQKEIKLEKVCYF